MTSSLPRDPAARYFRFAWLLACACLAVACADDNKPGAPQPPDESEGGSGGLNVAGGTGGAGGAAGFTDVTLPCEGFDYAPLGEELLTYSVQIHSENTDLTQVLATHERQTSFAMREVLVGYTCQQLRAMDLTSVETDLIGALEQSYQDETGEPGEIDTLSLHIEACE